MKAFSLHLQSPTGCTLIKDVAAFTGFDASGCFGILARHERFMTVLEYGFATVRTTDGERQYIAFPGGVLYFDGTDLFLVTHRYLISADYKGIDSILMGRIAEEEEKIRDLRQSLRKMEESMLKQLYLQERSGSTL